MVGALRTVGRTGREEGREKHELKGKSTNFLGTDVRTWSVPLPATPSRTRDTTHCILCGNTPPRSPSAKQQHLPAQPREKPSNHANPFLPTQPG